MREVTPLRSHAPPHVASLRAARPPPPSSRFAAGPSTILAPRDRLETQPYPTSNSPPINFSTSNFPTPQLPTTQLLNLSTSQHSTSQLSHLSTFSNFPTSQLSNFPTFQLTLIFISIKSQQRGRYGGGGGPRPFKNHRNSLTSGEVRDGRCGRYPEGPIRGPCWLSMVLRGLGLQNL